MASSSRLPLKANVKAQAIDDATQAAQAMVSATLGMMRELRDAIRNNPGRQAEFEAEIDRLSERLETQQARHCALADLNASIRHYLEKVPPGASIETAPRLKVRLKEGESLTRAIDRIRDEIADQIRERHRVLRAELPIADRKRAARAYVNELAAKGSPRIAADHDRFELNFPSGISFGPKPDVQALLAWLNPEKFRERLCDEIDAMPKPKFALSTDAKRDRLREIKTAITELEREEEGLIEKAADEGFDIARRPDASPAVILGIVINKKAQVAA
ncbi:MAG: hypothetical protein K5821_11980 [Nitrobacter sp.]|uniref:hypothetical protein n=1 Tax=Nitrobacter sp. TaxID=29420 RepID=UPI00260778CC|nr:hypothetical protein [Nitrobacter sp.]MCV0387131.1 hypothetical protein [Nitrobacter sp.]